MTGEKPNIVDPEKISLWEKTIQELRSINTDNEGLEIEKGIIETVAAINLNGIPTIQSCGGHFEDDIKRTPYINVCAPKNENSTHPTSGELNEPWKAEMFEENSKLRHQVVTLLTEFYSNRTTPHSIRLTISRSSEVGDFYIESLGGEDIPSLPENEQKIMFEKCKKEMQDFTEFLKERFFSA